MPMVALRYDLRVPEFAATTHAAQYQACLEQCRWGDERGFDLVVLSEHHGTDDGYMPSPLTLASAIAGSTRRVQLTIAALLVPLHDPVRLAEQLATLDLVSGGRVGFVAGLGYRYEEFEMADVDRSRRGALLEEYVDVMRRAWTGEPFEWRGRTIRVTPTPISKPHPVMLIGGSTERAARRAARLHLGFFPAIGDPALADVYREECAAVGFDSGFVSLPSGPGMMMVSEDPERTWAQIAPHALFDAQTYAQWQTPGQRSSVHVDPQGLDDPELKRVYRVVTPDECVQTAGELGDFDTLLLHPLMGGIAPDLAWESLELFESRVLPPNPAVRGAWEPHRAGIASRVGDGHGAFEAIVATIDYQMWVVTTAAGGQRSGCLVGFTTQCSMDPVVFGVWISKANHTFGVAAAADVLVVHALRERDREVARLFGSETGDEVDKFARCAWTPGPDGIPVLDGCDWFAGRVMRRIDTGDHVAHLLDPFDGEVQAGDGERLTFQRVRDIEPGHEAG